MFAASFDSKMGCLYSVFDVKKQGETVWVVRARNWKLRGGENRLSGLLGGVSVSGNVFTWLSSYLMILATALRGAFLKPCYDLERGIPQVLLRS
ncbi:hypothetical protein GQ457_02G029110 [Hibiscus cannabinus]